jgi:glycosyltransferase involved in cell wall biosynthesis
MQTPFGPTLRPPAAKVAVVTRTKDRNLLLRRAISSVLSQAFADWIMVIVNDGGSEAGVDKLVEEHREQFRGRCLVVHSDIAAGMEAASNVGLRSSSSEYVVIHDDDDSWAPSFLQKCVNALEANRGSTFAGVISHTTRILERVEDGRIAEQYREPFNTWLQAVTLYRMAAQNVFPPISFVYRRSVLDEIGYYREDLPVLGDWEFNLRFMSKYDILLLPEKLAYYHHRLQSETGDYSNSVVKDDTKHRFYDTLLRNELLRKDLNAGVVGLGHLVNISKSFEVVHAQLSPIEAFFNRLKGIQWVKRAAKRLLWRPRRSGGAG